MNDLKSDLFPSLGCLRGDVAPKGEEPGRRGRVHLGRRLLLSLANVPGATVLGSPHRTSHMDRIFHS